MFILRFLKTEKDSTLLILKILSIFWIVTKVWSYKLWIADRVYPVIPASEYIDKVPNCIHLLLFIASIVLLLLIVILKKSKLILSLLFIVEICSCVLDAARWQPWEYMYICILLVIILNFKKPKNILFLIHIFFVSIYLFSGLHKVNRNFLSQVWLNMFLIDYLQLKIEIIIKYKLFFLGFIIPIIEVSLALFFNKNKKLISFLLIGMHLSILLFLGPFGIGYNSIVWIWNLAMISMLYILYIKPLGKFDKIFVFKNIYWNILWFVLPIFSFYGYWYQYLSFNLYSGKGNQMYFCVLNSEKNLKPYFDKNNYLCPNSSQLNLQNWAMKEIKSAPSPEKEVNEKIKIFMEKKYQKGIIETTIITSENTVIKN